MKKAILFVLFFIFIIVSSSAQVDSLKKYSLRDYVAPDIKYQRMDLSSGFNMNGTAETESNSDNNFRGNLYLNYYEYINLSKFQGISDVYFRSSFQSQKNKEDTLKSSAYSRNIQLAYYGQNRFYNDNETFWGVHGYLYYNYSPYYSKTNNESYSHRSHSIRLTPYFSFGKGRIQPVESARQALVILIAVRYFLMMKSNFCNEIKLPILSFS